MCSRQVGPSYQPAGVMEAPAWAFCVGKERMGRTCGARHTRECGARVGPEVKGLGCGEGVAGQLREVGSPWLRVR